jgi:SAM-dependent methyltransferase
MENRQRSHASVWRALKAVNRTLPARAQRVLGGALDLVGIKPPRTTDDLASDWASRGSEQWLQGYRDSWDRPHRHLLVGCVARFEPLSSVLELGCHAGPNLRLLARRFPDARIIGIDVNLPAIEEARRSLADCANVTASHGDLRGELARLEDDAVDCVVSCFALAYVDPHEIGAVLGEAWRVARKALIVLEPHPGPGQAAEPSGWRHEYALLMNRAGIPGAHTEPLERDERAGELNAVTIAAKAR